MTVSDTQSPAMQALAMARLARAALPRWNIDEADVTLLKLRENAVFRIDVASAPSFVMRIHRRDYHSDGELLPELHWLQALAAAGIETPSHRSGRERPIVRTSERRARGGTSAGGSSRLDGLGSSLGAFWESSTDDLSILTSNFRLLGELAARKSTTRPLRGTRPRASRVTNGMRRESSERFPSGADSGNSTR